MTRENYRRSLAELEQAVLEMGDLVVERLDTGLDAMARDDDRLARTVVGGDTEVNERYLEIEKRCIELFARQQPVAGDLRLIAASFKISTDLERIGDLAVNLGEYTLDSTAETFPEIEVTTLGRFAVAMLETALEAYATEDAEACHGVAGNDDDLDTRCERAITAVVQELIETNQIDSDATEVLVSDVSRLLLTVRDLERVGDHAVNIAARTLYLVENDVELIY